jgi:hypothetical protein
MYIIIDNMSSEKCDPQKKDVIHPNLIEISSESSSNTTNNTPDTTPKTVHAPIPTKILKPPQLLKTESEEQIRYIKKYGTLKPRRESKTKNKGQRFDSADYFQHLSEMKKRSQTK